MTPKSKLDAEFDSLPGLDAEFDAAPDAVPNEELPVRDVETPQGVQQMRGDRPVLSPEQIKQHLDGVDANAKVEAYKAILAGLQGPANFLTDRVAGVKAAVQAIPKWMEGDGRDLTDIYAKGRDEARQTVDDSVRAYPMAPLVGSLATLPLSPVGSTGLARVGSSTFMGGLGAFGASRGDDQLGDTLKGAGLGLGVGGTIEGLGQGARFIAGRAGQQAGLAEDVIRKNAEDAVTSAASATSQQASTASTAMNRIHREAMETVADPRATPEMKAQAEKVLADPRLQAWLVNLRTNALASLGSTANKFEEASAKASDQWASLADDAAALGASKIENAGEPLGDAFKRQLFRAGVGAVGAGVGAGVGAITDATGLTENGKFRGAMGGGLAGFGTSGFVQAFRNNMGNPQTQLLFNRGAQSLLSQGADAASQGGLLAAQVGAQSGAYTGRDPVPSQLRDLLSLSRGQQFDPAGRPFDPAAQTSPARSLLPGTNPSDTSAPDAGFEQLKKRLGLEGQEKLSEQHYLGQ